MNVPSRLVQGIRDSENGTSSGMLGQTWNINVENQEAEFMDDLREASGVGKRKGKVRNSSANQVFPPDSGFCSGAEGMAWS